MASLLVSLGRWRPGHLLLAWMSYWAGLALVTIGPAIPSILRATSAPQAKGSISAGFESDVLHLTVTESGATLWSGTTTFSEFALLTVVPPLLLWVAWLFRRRARRNAELGASAAPRELPLPNAEDVAQRRRERAERPREDA
jgi:hypothetical protein